MLDFTVIGKGGFADLFEGQGWFDDGARGCAFGVVGVGGEAEADAAGVGLFGGREELGEAGVFAEEKREDAGGHGVEGAKVADGFFAG